jgi:hypothetical protein
MNDLQDRLDSSFGSGPAHPPLAPVLTAGHRAVRRRRLAAAGGALVVLAVAGGTGVALAGGHPSAEQAPVTHQPTVAPSPTQEGALATDTPEESPPWAKHEYARYLPDGTLQIRPGAVVHDRVYGYLDGNPVYAQSVAFDISYEGDRQWLALDLRSDGRGGSSGYTAPSDGWATFRAWVADQAAANGVGNGGDGYPDLVKASAACAFTTVDPARMLAETTTALPPGFDRAAHVVQDGSRYLVLCQVIDGRPDVIKIHAEKHGDTLAELLDYARGKYASGEGVR